jgi:hypothetical protein
MTTAVDLTNLISALKCGDPQRQAAALDEANRVVHNVISEAVAALLVSSARFPIAERLVPMGLSLRQSLENLLKGDADFEAKTFAAVVLLKIGCPTGVNHLISALKLQTPGVGLIAASLSQAGIREAADVIAEILRRWDLVSDPYTAATLISSLKRYGNLPEDVRALIRTAQISPSMRTALESLADQGSSRAQEVGWTPGLIP